MSPIDDLVKQAIEIGAWKEKKDGAKTYFYNAKTKETCWDLTKQFNKDPVKEALASGVWKEKKDGEKTYYYNTITKKTTWSLEKELGVSTAPTSSATTPASATNSEDPVAAALASGLWKEKKDPKGKTYYYNTKTKETCWDLAKQLGVSSSAASTPSAAATGDPVADALASGLWKEKKDPKGKSYFYNTKTKETCWDLAKHLGVSSSSAAATPRAQDDEDEGEKKRKQQQEAEEAAEREKQRLAEEQEELEKKQKKEAEDKEEELRKQLLAPKKKEEVWKPPPPPAFPPPPPQSRHPSSQLPVYDTTNRRLSSATSNSSTSGIDPSKTGGWRNYSKTRWLEELENRMGTALSPTRDQLAATATGEMRGQTTTADSSTSPMKQKSSGSPTKQQNSAALEMASITGVISAQETLQDLTTKTIDQKGTHQQQNTFVDFRDGASQTVFGPPTADVGVATLHAASNIAELIPIPDAGLMSCSTLESLKREQERALVLLQHVQGTLASQMQEAGVAFTGHGSTRQLRLNIAKPKTGKNKTDEAEAVDLAKELAPAYRSLQAPPSGPYWRFVTEHESNSLYDEASTRRARVVQNLTSGTTQRHELFDRISNELRDQYVLRDKMWSEYSRVNANSFVDVADFVLKTENEIKNQRAKEDALLVEKRSAANKADEDDDY